MRILNLFTVCLFLLIGIFNGLESSAILIRVSTLTGNDNLSCLLSNATTPCKTVTFALNTTQDSRNRNETDFTFLIEDQVYYLEKRINITQTSPDKSVILKSSHSTGSIIYCVNISAGIEIGSRATHINKTRNINFVNLHFENCGPRFAAAVIIWNSVDINFTNCVFKHNNQAGINAFDSAVTIDSCLFLNNTSNGNNPDEEFKKGLTSAGGGASFVFCYTVALALRIRNSNFTLNSAVTNDSTDLITPSLSSNVTHSIRVDAGGGLLVFFLQNTTHCQVVIEDTIFLKNSATTGGGLFFANANKALGNSYNIKNSTFLRNIAGQAGGGLFFAQLGNASRTTTIFKNCTVSENLSRRGAGMNVFLMNYDKTPDDSVLRFDTVVFSKNVGNSSTAIRFATALPYGRTMDMTPEFVNCTIEDHIMSFFARTSPFTSRRVNISFKGHNFFWLNNGGGAAKFQDCVLEVHGQLVFANNTGLNGGAMFLGSSQIVLYPGSELTFLGNEAPLGGAISVAEHTMDEIIYENNPDCFLAYSDPLLPPSKWKTNIFFIENMCSTKGAAIYVSSLWRCAWTEEFPHHDPQKALRWSSNFVYQNNSLILDGGTQVLTGPEYDIATDTKSFHSTKDNFTVKLSPGETYPLNVQALDELGHNVSTSALLFEDDNSTQKLVLQRVLYILSPNNTVPFSFQVPEALYNETHNRKDKDMRKIEMVELFSTFQNGYSFEFELQVCRPGFHYSSESMKCQCSKQQAGVISCGDDMRTVYLKEGYWGGEVNGGLVTYFCPPNYCRCVRKGNFPGCVFNPDRTDDQCANNRTGVLCGKCHKGLSVGLRLEECLECEGGAWIIAIVVIIVVIVCVVIIILNPCMSSELRGPLFFFQVLPFVFKPNNDVGRTVLFAGNVLNFGNPVLYSCIIKGMNNLYAVAFGYLMPFVIILVFLVCYILSAYFYLVRFKLRKNSSLQSFWLMTLFAYNYLAVTTFMLLNCSRVGEKDVFFYDGNMECFKGEHLVMAVVAIVVLCGLVVPLPVVVLLLTKGCCRVDPQYVSTLINGLRPHCCWWWSVDMCRRMLLMATYSFISNWNTKQVVMSLMCALILAVHSIFQPYTLKRVNVVESLYLYILCILATVQFLQEPDSITNIVCSVLLIATALHTVALTVYKAVGFFKRRFKCPKRCTKRRTYRSVSETSIDRSVDDHEEQRAREDIFNTIFSESEESKSFSNYSE